MAQGAKASTSMTVAVLYLVTWEAWKQTGLFPCDVVLPKKLVQLQFIDVYVSLNDSSCAFIRSLSCSTPNGIVPISLDTAKGAKATTVYRYLCFCQWQQLYFPLYLEKHDNKWDCFYKFWQLPKELRKVQFIDIYVTSVTAAVLFLAPSEAWKQIGLFLYVFALPKEPLQV